MPPAWCTAAKRFKSARETRTRASTERPVAAPASFAGVSGALTVPTWCLNVFAVGALCQLASVVRSTLAAGGDELSQSDITGGAVSNWALARMVGSANPLQDTVLAAIDLDNSGTIDRDEFAARRIGR